MAVKKAGSIDNEASESDQNEATSGTLVSLDHDAIAHRAYELYCEWGLEDGHDLAHWFEAERQLTAEKTTEPGNGGNPTDAAAAG